MASCPCSAIETQEQVADGFAPAPRQPAPPLVLGSVMNEMAALAQRLQVPRPILSRIMIEVCTGKHHSGRVAGEGRGQLSGCWHPPQRPASA
jgi:hypothetical protein